MSLIFVYNANSGRVNALLDAGHKLFSPSTYPCSLCALTYDTFTENTLWKAFRQDNKTEMTFYHKDEFERAYPNLKITYPAVLKHEDEQLSIMINQQELENFSTVESLIERLRTSL